MPRVYTRRPLYDRFWEKTEKDGDSGCILWTGMTYGVGYGQLFVEKGFHPHAHRVSWALRWAQGEFPPFHWWGDKLEVMHLCDNPPCVNPEHLRLGSYTDNSRDMRDKGRGINPPKMQGDTHPQAKHTWDEVREIRRVYETGNYNAKQIAKMFDIPYDRAWRIVTHRQWKGSK